MGARGQQQASTELSHSAFWRQSREIPAGLSQARTSFFAIVLASVVSEHGLAAGFTAALLSGVFLMVFGLTRLGRFIVYIPHSLLSGFFTAAGIVLVVTQVLPAIGLSPAPGGVAGSVKAWTSATVILTPLLLPG